MTAPSVRSRGNDGALTLALPRGSLFEGCLAMLDGAGFDTSEPRSDSRALIFALDGLTIVTVRPSDVPIYVESGAADLGVTGKDVLAEQSDRAVYELVDLGFGRWMGRQAEVIEVKGSVELAPLVGLADGIVDLVDTGRTLAENGLEVVEEISVCTARLIANRVAHKLRVDEVDAMVERLREAAAG